MHKPNTSLRGYEAPSLRPPDCASQLADSIWPTWMRRAVRGRTFAADRSLPACLTSKSPTLDVGAA